MMPDEGGGLYSKEDLFTTIYSIGSTGHGAGLFYRVTGYEPALELCRGLARWALAPPFQQRRRPLHVLALSSRALRLDGGV